MKKTENKESKNKGGRPRKAAILATGSEAAKRFAAGLGFAIKGGPHPKKG